MKTLLAFVITIVTLSAHATLFSTNWSSGFVNGVSIPDAGVSPWVDARTIDGIEGTIQDIQVTLDLSGGYNGDLYAYLTFVGDFGGGHTVLLNRVGKGAGSEPQFTFGYSGAGMSVTFADGGVDGNIHDYGGGYATGTYSPDGVGFAAGDFLGQNPNGTWYLYIQDMSSGGTSTINSWGLDLNIVAVPEVETWVAAALAGLFGAFWLNRQIWGTKRA